MKVQLFHGDISKVSAEGLVCPVEGNICVLGGSAAATALKNAFDPEEREELFGYLESDVKRLFPIPMVKPEFLMAIINGIRVSVKKSSRLQ